MNIEKVTITDKLRLNITERRKDKGLSSYALSEITGHSKFWLQNIESGKTKMIKKADLISIYKNLMDDCCYDDLIDYIESLLNQQVGSHPKQWYELINISDDFSEEYNHTMLISKLHDYLCKDIYDLLAQKIYDMPVNQAQAALTSIQSFYNSVYTNPELTLALINIPIYGVNPLSVEENELAMNDILAMGAKYNDLVVKNNSIEMIKNWHERDKQQVIQNKKAIQEVCKTFNNLLSLIASMSNAPEPPVRSILDTFYTSVVFPINNICPGALSNEFLSEGYIDTGSDFVNLISACNDWFYDHEEEYDLQFVNKRINSETYSAALRFLKTVQKVPERIQTAENDLQ
ncbi:MAG: hypothetical protein LUD12_12255 [Lachnospiraceae bacterium]|nr:hypothetical protein [Lachnospiraceae bacterium]